MAKVSLSASSPNFLFRTSRFLLNFGNRVRNNIRFGIARAHRIDGDAFGSDFERNGTRKTDDAVLCRTVGTDVGIPCQPRRAGYVHDAPPLVHEH